MEPECVLEDFLSWRCASPCPSWQQQPLFPFVIRINHLRKHNNPLSLCCSSDTYSSVLNSGSLKFQLKKITDVFLVGGFTSWVSSPLNRQKQSLRNEEEKYWVIKCTEAQVSLVFPAFSAQTSVFQLYEKKECTSLAGWKYVSSCREGFYFSKVLTYSFQWFILSL